MAELKYIYDKGVRSVFVLDDNFFTTKKRLFEVATAYKKTFSGKKKIKFGIMIRPELLDREVIKCFKDINVSWVQIGLQSINPDVQYFMSRPKDFDFNIYKRIFSWMDEYGIKLRQLDIIYGMPGDSLGYFKKTMRFAISLQPTVMQIKQLRYISDTLMEINQEKYKIKISKSGLLTVPFVKSSLNFSARDMNSAVKFVLASMKNNPKIFHKLIAEVVSYRELCDNGH